ncbi:MAG: phospholipase D family protein [Myxococcota bacterium]|nr:phospholipase D family protein [Myxococcota bacterium]MDW8361939.1 phospholipase D family protein [Myxococcales bacterium]
MDSAARADNFGPGGRIPYDRRVDADFVRPPRRVELRLVSGRGHHDAVVGAIAAARRSVWIATANVKQLIVEDASLRPGRPRALGRSAYRSVLALFDELAAAGVELRLLHARPPSRAFCDAFDRHPRLVRGGLELRCCPRVHFKAVIVDGQWLYLGSANWTGSGLGARGTGRRNFELGLVTEDEGLLDEVQALFDALWRGLPCARCRLREVCEMPLEAVERSTRAPRVSA